MRSTNMGRICGWISWVKKGIRMYKINVEGKTFEKARQREGKVCTVS